MYELSIIMKDEKEIQRLRTLRDRQLNARDPLAKDRKLQRQVSEKNIRRSKNQIIFKDIWKDIPHKWKGAVYGFGLGILILFFIQLLFSDKINILVALFLILAPIILGYLFGSSFDWRDDLRDF